MEIIECKVKTGAKKNSIKNENGKLVVELSAKPVQGLANRKLLKFLKKELRKDVKIVKGHKSHQKLIKIE